MLTIGVRTDAKLIPEKMELVFGRPPCEEHMLDVLKFQIKVNSVKHLLANAFCPNLNAMLSKNLDTE